MPDGRKWHQETTWEHDTVECFTVLGGDRRASVECGLCVDLICRWLHLPFLNHPDYIPAMSNQNETGALSFSVGVWPGSLLAAVTSCAVSAALSALRMHSTLCLVLLSGDAGFFSHLLDWNMQGFLLLYAFFIVDFVLSFFLMFWQKKKKSFKNLPEAGYRVSHIWNVELGLPGQWRLNSELSEVGCL